MPKNKSKSFIKKNHNAIKFKKIIYPQINKLYNGKKKNHKFKAIKGKRIECRNIGTDIKMGKYINIKEPMNLTI